MQFLVQPVSPTLRETGIIVLRLARQLLIRIKSTILSVSFSSSPKSFSGSQSIWSLPSPRTQILSGSGCPAPPTQTHPDPQMPAGLLGHVQNLLSQTVQLMSKGSKMHQKNQNSGNKKMGTLLKPYIP